MSFEVDDSGPIFQVRYFGAVDDDVVTDSLDTILATEGFRTKDQLVDYTDVDCYSVTMAGLKRLPHRLEAHIATYGPRDQRNAYVVPEDVEYGMGRVFLAHIDADDRSQLFRTRAEACAWLGVPDA